MEINNINDNEIKEILNQYQNATEIDSNELEQIEQTENNEIIEFDKKEKKGRRKKEKQIHTEINLANVLSSDTLILIIDLLLPNVFALAGKYIFKKKISASKLQLTPEEIEKIKPLADKALEKINFEANPVTLFFVSLILIYITKLINE